MKLTKKIQTLALQLANGVDAAGEDLIVELAKAGYGNQGEETFKIFLPDGTPYKGHKQSRDGYAFANKKIANQYAKRLFPGGCSVVTMVSIIIDQVELAPEIKKTFRDWSSSKP